MGQVSGDGLGDDAQHPAHQFWVGSYKEAQGEQGDQHPLADRPGRQYFVHQQLGQKGEVQLFLVVAVAGDPEKAVLQVSTLQATGELLLHVLRQTSAYSLQVSKNRRLVARRSGKAGSFPVGGASSGVVLRPKGV